jgi:ABC-2 type transport system ATP-binding protein
MIVAKNLTKAYGQTKALRGIDFEVGQGEIVGLLGPNGAGKTTTIKILTGALQPDRGTVTLDGLDVLTQTRQVQRRIGYLPENTPLYYDMSVQGYLKLMARMRGLPEDEIQPAIARAIIDTNLQDHRSRPIADLSKGLRQRVGLAQAILHRPRLIILDEPTVGLDPVQIIEIRHLIKRLAEHSTILFSSHILSEVQAVCDRVIILINGEVKADNRLDELEVTTDAVLVLGEAVPGAERMLHDIDGVVRVQNAGLADGFPALRILAHENADIFPAVYDLARTQGWPLRELRRDTLTLETVFNRLSTVRAASVAVTDDDDHDDDD